MNCDQAQALLPGFQLGALEPQDRAALEHHLGGCLVCVRAYVDLKRSLELAEDGPAPSARARARLRGAVLAELGRVERPRAWWERPLAVALAAGVTLFSMASVQALRDATPRAPVGLAAQR